MTIEKFTGHFNNEANGVTILVNNTVQLLDNAAALGVYAYLLTKPDDWKIHPKEIMRHFKMGKDKAYALLNELIDAGLLTRTEIKEDGKFKGNLYCLYLKPVELSPCPGKPDAVTPDEVNQDTYKEKKVLNKEIKLLLCDLEKSPKNNNAFSPITPQEVVDAYHKALPDSPEIRSIDDELAEQLKQMMEKWPKYQKDGDPFSINSFLDYLQALHDHYPVFVKEYINKQGKEIKNNLRVFTTDVFISKVVNKEFQ